MKALLFAISVSFSAVICSGAAGSDDPVAPGPGFRFVKAPKKSGAISVGGSAVRRAPRAKSSSDWFWDHVSTDIDAADPARLDKLRNLTISKFGGGQQSDLIARVQRDWKVEISRAAADAQISQPLLAAIIAAESSGDPNAVSRSGAMGLAQLMPETASRFGVASPFDPQENLMGAAAYLSVLLDIFGGDVALSLAAYNAGDGAVREHNGVPPYAETRAYVPKVLNYLVVAEKSCAEPISGARSICDMK